MSERVNEATRGKELVALVPLAPGPWPLAPGLHNVQGRLHDVQGRLIASLLGLW
jgi:hypothetical protein